MIIHIKSTISSVSKQWKAILLIYGIQAVIAFTIGLQVYQVLDASIGSSMSLNVIAEGFNRTVFTDLFNVHGGSLSPLIGLTRWIVLLYALLSVFLHGGLMSNLISGQTSIRSFLTSGYKYYRTFLLIALVFLLLLIIWVLILVIPFLSFVGGNPFERFDTEIPLVFWTGILLIVMVVGIGYIWAWSVRTRSHIIVYNKGIRKALISGFRDTVRKFIPIGGIICFLILIYILSMFLYTVIMEDRGAQGILVLLLLIVLQQFFALYRIGLKTIGYSAIIDMGRNGKKEITE